MGGTMSIKEEANNGIARMESMIERFVKLIVNERRQYRFYALHKKLDTAHHWRRWYAVWDVAFEDFRRLVNLNQKPTFNEWYVKIVKDFESLESLPPNFLTARFREMNQRLSHA